MISRAFCRVAISLACALLTLQCAWPRQSPAPSPNIRIDVDRVNVGVLVTDQDGRFLTGLQRENFRIFDDGVEQQVSDFISMDEPAQVLLLIEAGPAVYMLRGGHLQVVNSLLEGLAPNDRVAIARYNETAEPLLNFSTDKEAAFEALDELQFNLGFGQLNLASSLWTALDWLAKVPGKKSIVLLSTGVDTSPPAGIQKILTRLQSTDVRVLAVSLGRELRVPVPAEKKHSKGVQAATDRATAVNDTLAQADEELKAIAEANGSRVYFPSNEKDYSSVFAQIAELVRHEYSLAFIPPARDGKLHTIKVQIIWPAPGKSVGQVVAATPLPGYHVDHRQAYIAPSPGQP
ncbi:MAG TPA: VWA domain-containing protein [Candidatus Acidoferrum sp.]|nr:VWA domain-containing protein [Candidatus Acidoferrum sp.]